MKKTRITALLYGWIALFAILLFTSFILSILLRFTSLGSATLNWTTLMISLVALFAGGLVAGLKGKEQGWLLGGIVSIGFTLFVLLYQYLGYNSGFSFEQLMQHVGFLICALIGGVLGVNLSSDASTE